MQFETNELLGEQAETKEEEEKKQKEEEDEDEEEEDENEDDDQEDQDQKEDQDQDDTPYLKRRETNSKRRADAAEWKRRKQEEEQKLLSVQQPLKDEIIVKDDMCEGEYDGGGWPVWNQRRGDDMWNKAFGIALVLFL